MPEPHVEMVKLRNNLKDIATLIPRGKPVVYLDYPVYLNIGDLLIESGTELFFRTFGYHLARVRSALDFHEPQARVVDPQATIVLHGGGNFGDLYDLHQTFRERVIARFPHNRIVLLPQTIHFVSHDSLAQCVSAFAGHPNLHVCLRDRTSYNLFRRHFPNPAYLFPDMAHFLWDECAPLRRIEGHRGTLFFMRADKEKSPMADQYAEGMLPIDWCDIISPADRVVFALLDKLHRHHARILPSHDFHPLWRIYRDHMKRKATGMLVQHDAVVTDRLHMALLALLLGRKVAMVDNSYGKLSAYHACWLKEISTVRLLSARAPDQCQRSSMSAVG